MLLADNVPSRTRSRLTFANGSGLRKKITSTAFRTLRSLGAFSLSARSRRRRDSLLILCYHGLSLNDEHEWLPQLYITPAQFRQRLTLLRNANAAVLPFDEAIARLHTGSLPPRSVAITFDDGFYDFLHHGIPILSEFGYPCTVYLTTHYCDHQVPVIGLILDYLLWKSGLDFVVLPEQGIERPMPARNYLERQKIVNRLAGVMERMQMNTSAKNEVARSVSKQLMIDYNSILQRRTLQILSAAEVQQVANAGIDIQLHTHRHRTPRDRALFVKEVEDNRRRIVDLTGKTPVHFCYPSGDYAPEFFGWLKECGVKSATTCEVGLASQNSQKLKLPRVLDHSQLDSLRFESVVSGLLV